MSVWVRRAGEMDKMVVLWSFDWLGVGLSGNWLNHIVFAVASYSSGGWRWEVVSQRVERLDR